MINRKPRFISIHNGLLPGDVLVIRNTSHLSWWRDLGLSLYHFYQSLIFQKHGHYDSTHAAICISSNNAFEPARVAHVGNQGYGVFYADPYSLPGPFWVYRPRDVLIAETMGNLAERSDLNNSVVWSGWEAFKAMFTPSSYPDARTPIPRYVSGSTICSKFILQVMQQAASTAYDAYSDEQIAEKLASDPREDYFPTINANSLPKTLESYLYQNENFELFCCPRQAPLGVLRAEISRELLRVGEREDQASRTKFLNSCDAFRAVNLAIDHAAHLSEFDKSLMLLSAMLPPLEVQTGFSVWNSTHSSARVLAAARNLGIFSRDIPQVVLEAKEEMPRRDEGFRM